MITEAQKENIRDIIDFHYLACTTEKLSDEYWEGYFAMFNDPDMKVISEKDSLLCWIEENNCVGIIDFAFKTIKAGFKLYIQLEEIADSLKKPIRGHIHVSNTGMLNMAWKRGYRIIGTTGNYQYLVERRVKHGRK